MSRLKIKSVIVKKYKPYSSKKADDKKEYINLLNQNFQTDKPGEKWLGDITYIYTKEQGWTYLAIVLDLFDLKVIGWEIWIINDRRISNNCFKKSS